MLDTKLREDFIVEIVQPADDKYVEVIRLFELAAPNQTPMSSMAWFTNNVKNRQRVGSYKGCRDYKTWDGIQPGLGAAQLTEAIAAAFHQPTLRLVEWSDEPRHSTGRIILPQDDAPKDRRVVIPGQLLELHHEEQALACFVDYPTVVAWAEDSPHWWMVQLQEHNLKTLLPDTVAAYSWVWPKENQRYAMVFWPDRPDWLPSPSDRHATYALLQEQLKSGGFDTSDGTAVAQVFCSSQELVMVYQT